MCVPLLYIVGDIVNIAQRRVLNVRTGLWQRVRVDVDAND